MPVFLLTDEALHVQPLHPRGDRAVQLFEPLGFGFFAEARGATQSLDARHAGMMLGLHEPSRLFEKQGVRPATPEEVVGLSKYRFPLTDLKRIAVGERFPALTLEILGPGIRRETYDLTPKLPRWVAGPASDAMRAYGRAIGMLVDAARHQGWPCECRTGWLDLPAVEWEEATFPDQEEKEVPTYRSAPQKQQRIVAERGPGGSFERLARRLLPRVKGSPSRVVLTAEDILAELVGRGVYRLPRGLPRWTDGRDVVFGRYAGMRLEPRDFLCPVSDLLIGDGPH